MNNLTVKKLTYHFQDLVAQKNIKTFKKFLVEVFGFFEMTNVNRISHKFIYKELKNIYTFLKIIQHYPNSYLLACVLKPLFKILLDGLVIPKIVFVGDRKYFDVVKIRYSDLILAARKKRITQVQNDIFVVGYNGAPIPRPVCKEDLLQKNWPFNFVAQIMIDKTLKSVEKYGGDLIQNPLSEKQTFELGERIADNYLNSDLNYLPREVFDFPKEDTQPEQR